MKDHVVFIRRKTLLERVPLSERHILNLEKQGLFPKRRLLSARSVAWVESEIDEWLASRQSGVGPTPQPVQTEAT